MDLESIYLPLLQIVDMNDKKQMEKCSNAMYIYFIILFIITLMYVNCNRRNVVMASPNCMNENLLKIV